MNLTKDWKFPSCDHPYHHVLDRKTIRAYFRSCCHLRHRNLGEKDRACHIIMKTWIIEKASVAANPRLEEMETDASQELSGLMGQPAYHNHWANERAVSKVNKQKNRDSIPAISPSHICTHINTYAHATSVRHLRKRYLKQLHQFLFYPYSTVIRMISIISKCSLQTKANGSNMYF